jgi:CheY-like chemotaxis protein
MPSYRKNGVRIFSRRIRPAPWSEEVASHEQAVSRLTTKTKDMNTLLENPRPKTVVPPPRNPAHPSQQILVVEDDVAIRRLNALVLVHSGYQVDAAEDGAAGWEALHGKNFDLLITDHEMPRLSGVELVKKVRAARMTLPVILATGALPEEELERHPWLQLAATLLKPFSSDQLLATVKEVLRVADRASFGPPTCFPPLPDSFRHRSPYRHWGLND